MKLAHLVLLAGQIVIPSWDQIVPEEGSPYLLNRPDKFFFLCFYYFLMYLASGFLLLESVGLRCSHEATMIAALSVHP